MIDQRNIERIRIPNHREAGFWYGQIEHTPFLSANLCRKILQYRLLDYDSSCFSMVIFILHCHCLRMQSP